MKLILITLYDPSAERPDRRFVVSASDIEDALAQVLRLVGPIEGYYVRTTILSDFLSDVAELPSLKELATLAT